MSATGQPDHTSKVPFFSFPNTLDAQEEALSSNSLMQRFAASRQTMATDPHRPLYHFVSPEHLLNDPNGLCFWQGNWHLFYQGYPPEDPRQHWGHAVSRDLTHWRDLPYAIYPHPEHAVFSGSALVETDRVIAIYHGTKVGNMVATSQDPLLLNWEKLTGAAVIPISGPNGEELPYRVFDPCIWKKGNHYYSLSGGTLPHPTNGRRTRADFLLKSKDLANWEYLHPFVEGDTFTLVGDDGACPYFWPIGDRHMLLFFSHMSGGQALLGDYDEERDKFVATSHHEFNFGPYGPGGVHAPSAVPDGKGGLIVIFNMNPAKPTSGWNQIMTLPRRITLQGTEGLDKDSIFVEPAGDISTLRGAHVQVSDMALPPNEELVLEGISGNSMEIQAEIETGDSPLVELNVLRSPGKEEFTRIAFYRDRGFRNWERYQGWEAERLRAAKDSLITIDNSYSSQAADVQSRAPETAPVFVPIEENLKLRIFIDRSVVEVFVNGKQCVAVRVYPDRLDSLGVSLRAQGSTANIKSLDTWQLGSIYA